MSGNKKNLKLPNFTPKATRERTKQNPKLIKRKENIKIRSEINELQRKKTIVKISETKRWFFRKECMYVVYN